MDNLIAIFLGFVASKIQGEKGEFSLTPNMRFAISVIACVLCGLATQTIDILIDGSFNTDELLGNIGSAFLMSQTFYRTYFK